MIGGGWPEKARCWQSSLYACCRRTRYPSGFFGNKRHVMAVQVDVCLSPGDQFSQLFSSSLLQVSCRFPLMSRLRNQWDQRRSPALPSVQLGLAFNSPVFRVEVSPNRTPEERGSLNMLRDPQHGDGVVFASDDYFKELVNDWMSLAYVSRIRQRCKDGGECIQLYFCRAYVTAACHRPWECAF